MYKFIFLLLLIVSLDLSAQPDKVEILKPIKTMFDGMRAGDSLAVRSAYIENASMYSTFLDKDGSKSLRKGNLDSFVEAVGTPHDEVWDEQIFVYRVEQDGTLASVWTEYTFYLGDKLSHCGVNAFQLIDTSEGWKILNITDTRRKDNCKQKIN